MSIVLGVLILLLIAALLTLWFFLMPRLSGGADLSLLKRNYAHRGLWDKKRPPASIDAMTLAARLGYGVKIEVGARRDRTLMVAGTMPLPLSSVLSAIGGATPLMIEIGGKRTSLRLCLALAKMLDTYEGPFSIVSRDPKMLSWFKNYRPSFARGQIVSPRSNFATLYLLTNRLTRPDFLVVEPLARKNASVLLLTKIFRLPCFVLGIDTTKSYRSCRRHGEFAIFEKIRPRDPFKPRRR